MTGISNILPFLEHARTLRTYSVSISNQDLFLTKPLWDRMGLINEIPEPYKATLGKKIPTVLFVRPLGMLIMKGTDYDICAYKMTFENIFCNIVEVEYLSVAQTIEVDYRGDKIFARYPYLNGFLEEEITDTGLIDYTISGDVLYKPQFGYSKTQRFGFTENEMDATGEPVPIPDTADAIKVASTGIQHRATPILKPVEPLLEWEDTSGNLLSLSESVSLEDFMAVNVEDAMSVSDTKSPQTIKLESYFTGGYVTNRTPLLVGPSAVAKSAMVKALTKKHGMRLVDVRLAFTSRLDIEGLTGRYEKNGVIMSEASPASFMLECSDAYIDFCREALMTLTQAQDSESNEGKKQAYQDSIDKFREGAKIPVLFLDEVTRAPSSVRQAFTKILSDKEFMGYPMSYARVVAATNVALGAPEELQGIYQTQDVGDAAFYDRFESIQIYPEDVRKDWMVWAEEKNSKGQQNIHPLIVKILKERANLAYDFSFLYDVYRETQNEDDVTSSPYPNYRTWDLVSNYIYARESSKTYVKSVIDGLVGEKAAAVVISTLQSQKWTEKLPSVDTLGDIIEQGMDTGTPVMMITPSSIGKTSRIKSVAKSRNALLIDINLAEQDRVDLLGPPVRVPVEKFVSSSITSLPEEMQTKLKETVKKYDLPSHVTIKAPKEDIITKLRDAAASGREVIIHFDELNRVQNPSVMSSVFECISDHRVLGVSFDPSNVRVFASCNMGENYSDAQSLDPAFSARFAMYKRTSYDKSDVEAFIHYMEERKFSKVIINFFKSRSLEECKQIIASVETRSLELSSASTRAWEDLDKFLKDEVNKNLCKGTVFLVEDAEAAVYQNFVRFPSEQKYSEVIRVIDSKIDNWAGLNSDIRVPITTNKGKETVTASELVSMYKEAKKRVDKAIADGADTTVPFKIMSNVLLYLYSVNREIVSTRGKIFKMSLGPFSGVFSGYYNAVSGISDEALEIKDCVNVDKFHKYVDQEIRGVTLPNEVSKKLLEVTKDFCKEFPSVDKTRARDVLNYCVSCISTSEAIGEYLRGLSMNQSVENLIVAAEDGDYQFSITLLKRAGIHVDDTKVKQAQKVVRQPRIK